MPSAGPISFSQRAKEWQTTPFVAEWVENTFVQCTSPTGKQQFEKWAIVKWGPQKGMEMAKECNKRTGAQKGKSPRARGLQKQHSSADKAVFMWNCAAEHYGVSVGAMHHWHQYASEMNLFQPERTKPAPRRRKGESSGQWMSLVDGHKLPNIDLDMARRTAIAEYDKTRDTMELWRTDSKLFFRDIVARSKSIIPSPEVLSLDERSKQRIAIDDAFRTRVNFLSMLHLAWKDAAELFEYLASKGLNTVSAVERAYQKDSSLLWRFVSAINRIRSMQRKMWANFTQQVAASEYYKPLLNTWREPNGLAHIEANQPAMKKRVQQGTFTRMDELVLIYMGEIAPVIPGFFQGIENCLADDPSQANKFSAAVFEALGDLAAVNEFDSHFSRTEFGNRLMQYAGQLEASGTDHAQMRSILAGEASRSIRALEDVWLGAVWQLDIDFLLQVVQLTQGAAALESIEMPADVFNEMWRRADAFLWEKAAALDRHGERGRVARAYGLYDPADPTRPVATAFLLRELDPALETGPPGKPRTTPAQHVQHIPLARPGESVVQSGYAFAASLVGAKEKVKTRGDAAQKEEPKESAEEEEEEERVYPVSLPHEFKIGKKILKLFHRVLEPPEDEKENAPAKGQVRWGDFEHAMKRIGFEVTQTAGSSVRFDPPASTARPITFHRPHPDSLLTPHQIKWVGARLKRTYGWTAATFQRSDAAE